MLPLSALDDACIMNDDNGNNSFLHHSTRQSRFLGTAVASSSHQRHSNQHQPEASNTAAQSLYSDLDSSNSNATAYIPPPPKYTPYNNSNLQLVSGSTSQSHIDSDSHRIATHLSTQVENRTWAHIWEDIEKAEHIEQARHNAGPQQPRRHHQQDLDHHHPASISSQARAQRRQSNTSHYVQFATATPISEHTGQEKKSNRVVRTLRKYLPLPGSTTSAAIFTGSASTQQQEQAARRISPIDTSRFVSSSSSSHPPPYYIHNNTINPRAAYTYSTPSASLDQTKQSMSSNLYNSTPIRLLAYAILFFNTLLVIKVMADPSLGGSGGGFGSGTGYAGNGQRGEQIRLGNGKGIVKGVDLEKKFPCVMATSHNDEMQAAPFSEAMSLGLTAIEVDTWLQDDILLAGHELKDLSKGKTVKSIYLDPLFKMLERANNPNSSSKKTGENDIDGNDEWDIAEGGDDDDSDNVEHEDDEEAGTEDEDELKGKRNAKRAESTTPSKRLRNWNNKDWKGVFPLAPKQDLMLMIDVKNDPEGQFKKAMQLLQPFIEKNYLTVFRDGKLIPGPVTIVGTGDTSLELVINQSPRYIFYDAPLVRLQYPIKLHPNDTKTYEWSSDFAPIASSKWLWWNYYPDVKSLKVFSDEAHKRGIKARWWGVARWPAYFRRALWNLQLRADVDWLNADDLADVAAFLRGKAEAKALEKKDSVYEEQRIPTNKDEGQQ